MPLHIWAPTHVSLAVMMAFLLGCAVFVGMVIRKRLRGSGAQTERQQGSKRDKGSLIGVAIQALAIAMCSGPLLVNGPAFPSADMPILIAFLALMSLTIGLFGWASEAMGKNWAIVARTRSDHELVTSGPFALVRNPIYVALFTFMLAIAIATRHPQALIIGIPLYAIGTAIRVAGEEKLLRAHFGAAYDAYAARVKRFVPGLF